MNEPKVSIILSNFNGGEYLKESIQSVINQTFQDWELILIDDCSTDNSKEIIQSFNDSRIKAIYFNKNQQMCYAFNYGILISNGKYIARIDHDDAWLPEKLEKQFNFMEQNPDYGACFTWVNVIGKDKKNKEKNFNLENKKQHEWLKYFYFIGTCLCHTSVLVRKLVLSDVGVYNYSFLQTQDYDLWIRIVKKYNIHIILEKLVNYRWSRYNASNPSLHNASIRANYELSFILSKYFDDISDELFIKTFGNDFVLKGKQDALHIECEKALLLLKPVFCGYLPKIGGMNKLLELLNNNESRKILLVDYGINQKYFYELASSLNLIPNKLLFKEMFLRLIEKIK